MPIKLLGVKSTERHSRHTVHRKKTCTVLLVLAGTVVNQWVSVYMRRKPRWQRYGKKSLPLLWISATCFQHNFVYVKKMKYIQFMTKYQKKIYYLPEDTETRQGLTVMNDNFVTYGTARVMVSNVTYETAENICSDLESIDGVTSVDFDDTTDHYKSASALFSVTFDGTTTDDISVHALHTIRDMLAGYDTYIDTEVGVDTSADLQSEMSVILVLAAIVIVLVLTLTSRSYAEVPVLIMTFGAAALLNMGTNFLCGTISFISNSVTVILQLALAIDYAIILCHRFSDEHETKDTREACIAALSKAIPEISSSSLTTISGLGALAFMHFGIGRDMATVLIKAILFSLLSVFTLMPGLLMVFSKKIDATRHKNLIPKITFLGKFDVATRFIVPPIFAVVVVVTAVLANKCPYCYSYTDLVTAKQSESQIAHQKIKNTFGVNNMVAVIVPTGDYDSERQLLKDLDSCAEVKSTQGLANIDAMDGYKLADALTPRQMSELAGLDYEVAEALYAAYAVDQNEYGKLISGLGDYKVPLFDMFMFLQREMKDGNITLDGDIQETLDDLFEQLNKAQLQLQSDKYSRLVVYLNLPEESDETLAFPGYNARYDRQILQQRYLHCRQLHQRQRSVQLLWRG